MRKISVLIVLMLAAAFASAATLTGTVKNVTTDKPSAGDDVALLGLSQGMSELAHTKTDAKGAFSFNIDDPDKPHLVRVTHDGVNYFPPGGPIRPGATTVEIPIYDAAKKVDGMSTTVDVLRVQADGSSLQLLELIALKNDSQPPRALSSEHGYEFTLPEGAQLDQMIAQAPGGMPVNVAPVANGKGGKYAVKYALKPGETRLEISYHMPYSGEASFSPKVTDNIQHFVVMMPKSMKFEAKDASRFSPMNEDSSANVQVATHVTSATDLSFRVSGTGMLPDEQQQQQGGQQAASSGGGAMGSGGADNRPGGGLGAPIDAPDPLHNFRWWILGGLAIVMASGGVFVVSRANQQQGVAAPAAVQAAQFARASAVAAPVSSPVVKDRSSMLLEALKEELFQLEIEKQQGRISAEEYDKSKAALDQTLHRALARQTKA